MNLFNRLIATLFWLLMLAGSVTVALFPRQTVIRLQGALTHAGGWLATQQELSPTNFRIGQAALLSAALLLFGLLLWLEVWPKRPRGASIRTAQGGTAILDPQSISRRLAWQLDQLADVIGVAPTVRPRKNGVDIELDVETAPDIDVAMKTDEVVAVTREILEQDMGLRVGKIDVRMRHAPFDAEWLG